MKRKPHAKSKQKRKQTIKVKRTKSVKKSTSTKGSRKIKSKPIAKSKKSVHINTSGKTDSGAKKKAIKFEAKKVRGKDTIEIKFSSRAKLESKIKSVISNFDFRKIIKKDKKTAIVIIEGGKKNKKVSVNISNPDFVVNESNLKGFIDESGQKVIDKYEEWEEVSEDINIPSSTKGDSDENFNPATANKITIKLIPFV